MQIALQYYLLYMIYKYYIKIPENIIMFIFEN